MHAEKLSPESIEGTMSVKISSSAYLITLLCDKPMIGELGALLDKFAADAIKRELRQHVTLNSRTIKFPGKVMFKHDINVSLHNQSTIEQLALVNFMSQFKDVLEMDLIAKGVRRD